VKSAGIDGCRGGWCHVWLDTDGFHGSGILRTIDEWTGLPDSADAIVLIDMPIGLKETGPHERQCDKAARKLLKKRGSSIFPAPCRQSLAEQEYLPASDLNQAVTGRRLSKQTYHLMPRIRELDRFIRGAGRRLNIREFHPELGFLALNRFVPLTFSKKTGSGQEERLKILSRHVAASPTIFSEAAKQLPRNQAGLDDILDALCGAVAASFRNHLVSLPALPETDPRGLPMQIVYADPDKAGPL